MTFKITNKINGFSHVSYGMAVLPNMKSPAASNPETTRVRPLRLRLFLATWVFALCGIAPVIAQTTWLNPANGDWSTAANWSGGLPNANVDAAITATGAAYTNSQSGGTITARTLVIDSGDATLSLTANALLNLSLTLPSTFARGAVALNGSRIRGNFTLGSAFTVRQTAGSSSLSFNRNNGLIRGTGGSFSLSGVNTGWTNGPGAIIEADGSGAIVSFSSTWANFGEVVVRNGSQLNVGGATTTAGLGTLRLFDTARMNLSGTIDNTGDVLTAPEGRPFDATGGTVFGGTIAPDAIVLRNRIGSGIVGLRLEGAIWEGDVAVTNNSIRFYPGATFTGTQFNAGGAFGVTYARTTTISNKIFTLTSDANQTTFTVGTDLGAAQTVTLAADTILRGTGFKIAGEVNNSTLVNQGTIHHLAGTSTTSALGTLRNEGRIQADAGFFSIAPGTLINDGIIEARAGGVVALAVPTFIQGTTGELRGAGRINLNAPISGGALRPGDAGIGTLTVQAGESPVTFTGPTTFAVEIGGATNDQLFFNNGSKGLSLSNGVVTLALTLLSPPTAQIYRVVNLANGNLNLLTGTFAGLPQGATLSAIHANSNYTFTVDYDTKGLTLRDPVATPISGPGNPPMLAIFIPSTDTVVVSWPSPSTGFVLQENSDLTTTNWVSPPQTPIENGPNRQITINPVTGQNFFRLFKP